MSKKEFPDYTIGIDLGTNSVGWAVINDDYKLLRLCGKDAWGALLADSAESAESRRLMRCARRRYARRRERIKLLRELFAPLIAPIDENFFIRLDESSLRVGDGEFFRKNHYNIFDDDYTDKDYFRGENTRTVYHLRKMLAETDEKADIRFVYLAVHHMVKYRGHFLLEGRAFAKEGNMLSEAMSDLFDLLGDTYGRQVAYGAVADEFLAVLQNKSVSRTVRRDRAAALFAPYGFKKYAKVLSGAVLGNKVSLTDLIAAAPDGEERDIPPIVGEDGKEVNFSFSDGKYEENEADYIAAAEDRQDIFLAAKRVYSALMFSEIMRGKKTLSEAMIDRYEKHARDLALLKRVIREYIPEEYKPFFRGSGAESYTRYIGNKKRSWYKDKTSAEDLYKYIKKLLEGVPDCEDKSYVLTEIEREDFLPLINSVANAHIPYQLNEIELSAILDNQGRFYPELLAEKDKIMSLLTFRRPYYVGPLKGDKYGWNEQEIEDRVTPWNFYDKVDTDALAEKFITRMTNGCAIFSDEEALPRHSIVWQAYTVLNIINKLKVSDKPISVDIKKAIFEELVLRKRKVRGKDIAMLLSRKYNAKIKPEDIKGLSGDDLDTGMTTYIDFRGCLGNDFDIARLDEYEETIRTLTIFDDTAIRLKRIKKQGIYTDGQAAALAKLKYTGWGRFSEKVLRDTKSHDGKNIIGLLYDTNSHFNELIFDENLGFKQQFDVKPETIERFEYSHVAELRCSPIVRKITWNALRIIDEIVDITGKAPRAIFLENTREEQVKKRKDSRVENLLKLYAAVRGGEYFNGECYEKLRTLEKSERLSDEKLYLWLTQLGRCMYSGDAIKFDEIGACQIDHIVPRCYITDDSFGNRVLVKTDCNQKKSDTLGISTVTVAKMMGFWTFLFEHGFITAKKFKALQKTEYTDADREGFIDRQLVDTSYSIKMVRELLLRRFPDAVVRGVKAGLNSSMRRRYAGIYPGFYKIRALNNFHHAKDAYITAVLGQFTTYSCPCWGNTAENRQLRRAISNPANSSERVNHLVNKRHGLVLDLFDSDTSDKFDYNDEGEFLWDETRRANVFATMAKNTCNIVKKQEPYAASSFYGQTIMSPRSGAKALQPLKYRNGIPMPTDVYGGYTSLNPAYFAVIEKDKRGKKGGRELVFATIPVITDTAGSVKEYIAANYGETAVIRRLVRKYQLINYKGQLCYISGESELQNAEELFVVPEYEKILYIADARAQARSARKDETKYFAMYERELEENDATLVAFIDYYCGKIRRFFPLYAPFADRMEIVKAEHLPGMTTADKLKLLSDMMTVASSGAGRVDFEKKYGGGQFGRLKDKTIYPDQVVWVDLSLTGLRRRERREEL